MEPSKVGAAPLLDLSNYPQAQAFVARCTEFFDEVKDLYACHLALSFSFPFCGSQPRS